VRSLSQSRIAKTKSLIKFPFRKTTRFSENRNLRKYPQKAELSAEGSEEMQRK
jgi:hypothetical protein